MGHIGHKFLPLIFALLQRGGHIVEGQGKILDFVGAFGIHLDPGIQIAETEIMGGFCHIPQRSALLAGDKRHHNHCQKHHQHGNEQISIRDLLQNLGDLFHRRGNNDDAHTETVAVGDGYGSYEPLFFIKSLDDAGGGNAAGGENILQKISDTYLFVSVLVVLLAVVMMSFVARKQSRPLRDMAKAAHDFGHGNLNARVQVDPKSSDEVQDLALAFNNMASSLQQSEYQRQEFVANVSHELKTPMTTISGFVDGMLDGTIPPERHKHYMHMVSDETKRLSRLVRSMLDISRLQDQDIPEEKKSRFELQELAGQVLITFEQKIDAKNLNVDVDFPGHPTYTRAGPDYITQVIYNLLDNAVKFCPEGGDLGMKIRTGTTKLYVSVSNSGETIPPNELALLFDRFHKLDKSRSQNRDGWGLGLYIVKTIIGRHGEDISVTSQNGITTFTFTLPLVN